MAPMTAKHVELHGCRLHQTQRISKVWNEKGSATSLPTPLCTSRLHSSLLEKQHTGACWKGIGEGHGQSKTCAVMPV
eukprot:33077-Rhodomonas_salina.10